MALEVQVFVSQLLDQGLLSLAAKLRGLSICRSFLQLLLLLPQLLVECIVARVP